MVVDKTLSHTPSGKKTDWNAGGNYIPSANYRVQAEGHFVTDCVCVAVTRTEMEIRCVWKQIKCSLSFYHRTDGYHSTELQRSKNLLSDTKLLAVLVTCQACDRKLENRPHKRRYGEWLALHRGLAGSCMLQQYLYMRLTSKKYEKQEIKTLKM